MDKRLGIGKKADIKLFFNQIELLVHPFFSLEMIRDRGTGEMLKNASVNLGSAAYDEIKIVENWKQQLQVAKRNPNAIVVLVGIKEKERATPKETPQNFFEGGLTKSKLKKFTPEYQAFLHEAKKVLGKRLVYITQGGLESLQPLVLTLATRGMAPARTLEMNAYGEYYKKGDANTCVQWAADNVKWVLGKMQEVVYPDKKVSINLTRYSSKGVGKNYRVFSTGAKGLLYLAAAKREFRTTGRVSPSFVRKHRRFQDGINPKREARNLTKAFRRH
jgi:hypothetical protein